MTSVTRDHLDTATKAFMKASIFDPAFNNPDAATVAAWAESIAHHALHEKDVIAAVAVHYEHVADRSLKLADVIKHGREVRRQRAEREKGREALALPVAVADTTTRQRIVTEISEKFGRRSDVSKVQSLDNLADLTIDSVMQALGQPGERWDRARAAKALHDAHCIERGEEVPTGTYVRPERRVVPLTKKERKARERSSRIDAVQHLATRGFHVATAFKNEGAA